MRFVVRTEVLRPWLRRYGPRFLLLACAVWAAIYLNPASGTLFSPAAQAKSPETVAVAPVTPVPTAKAGPTAPAPVLLPSASPSSSSQAMLSSIQADFGAHWSRTTRDTDLKSGPTDQATSFTSIPQGSLLKQLDSRPDWLLVYYDGDGATRQPGPGWVPARNVGGTAAPSVWLATAAAAPLWLTADPGSTQQLTLPANTRAELTTASDIQGNRLHVRLPGNGRSVPPTSGWVDISAIARVSPPRDSQLPWAYPADLTADIRLPVQYRSQLDGSDYEEANCGPTALGMTLEMFGKNLAPAELRSEVMVDQGSTADDVDNGSFVWALADVAARHNVHVLGLSEPDGSLHQWTAAEVRGQVLQHHPVILQVRYRFLPQREDSDYYGDHYVVVTGLIGEKLLYDDPIGVDRPNEGPGFDRLMSLDTLEHAMNASDRDYTRSGFALASN